MVMRTRITSAAWKMVWSHALGSPDQEVCGAIVNGEHPIPMANVSSNPEGSYVLDTTDQKFVWKTWASLDKSVPLILYHSHPRGGAKPSETDIEYARNHGVVYLIVSLKTREAKLYDICNGIPYECGLNIDNAGDGWHGHHPIEYVAPSQSKLNPRPACRCGEGNGQLVMSKELMADWWAKHLRKEGAESYAIDFEEVWRARLTDARGNLDLNEIAKELRRLYMS